jgi:hypothetical protein
MVSISEGAKSATDRSFLAENFNPALEKKSIASVGIIMDFPSGVP